MQKIEQSDKGNLDMVNSGQIGPNQAKIWHLINCYLQTRIFADMAYSPVWAPHLVLKSCQK